MFNDLFNQKRSIDPQILQQVKTWVHDSLQIEDDTSLLVTELRCSEVGCPPIETVIALLKSAHPTQQYKIHKPVAEITMIDIIALVHTQEKSAEIYSAHQE
ncbi:MAG: hypothetical protein H0V70_23440 [Ktedonobacteraceae bacterium]|nr:hypothetical protein [Ktedonobacteraceae bacterium]